MEENVRFNDDYQERMAKANEALLIAYDKLDPNDPHFYENLKVVTGLQEKISSDFKEYAAIKAEHVNQGFERERLDQEAERDKTEKKSNAWKTGISIASLAATVGMFIFGEFGRNKRINKVTEFEDDHAILKSSEKIAVQDCLRDDNSKKGGLLQLPFLR